MHHICMLKNNGEDLIIAPMWDRGMDLARFQCPHTHHPGLPLHRGASFCPESSKLFKSSWVGKGLGCGPRKAYVQIPHMYADLLCGLLQVTQKGAWGQCPGVQNSPFHRPLMFWPCQMTTQPPPPNRDW